MGCMRSHVQVVLPRQVATFYQISLYYLNMPGESMHNPTDTGMCIHGNFPATCKSCKSATESIMPPNDTEDTTPNQEDSSNDIITFSEDGTFNHTFSEQGTPSVAVRGRYIRDAGEIYIARIDKNPSSKQEGVANITIQKLIAAAKDQGLIVKRITAEASPSLLRSLQKGEFANRLKIDSIPGSNYEQDVVIELV